MAVTQYIGSRYVPLFADPAEWSPTKSYEALTIVLHEGNSYTSRQAVPVGVELTNEDYWLETGNYNAQIESYRQEVQRVAEDLEEAKTELKGYVDESKEGFEVGWISDTTGTCVICKDDTGVICLDVGSVDGSSALFEQQLDEFLDGQKIDVIVISHYHDDHASGYASVKRFAKDGCTVYEQMNPTANNTQYDLYLTNHNKIVEAFGAVNVLVPPNNAIVSVGDLTLRMINTDATNIAAYNATKGESNRNANGLNAFSIISFVSKNGNTLCFTGDAEGITQRLMVPYTEPCDVVTTPHHAVNYLGYSEFFDKCKPSMFLYTKRNTIAYDTIPIQSFTDRFAGKYALANDIPYLNGDSKCIFELSNNQVHITHGVICNPNDGALGYAYSPMAMLGTAYYSDDPYSLLNMTGEDFLNNCRAYSPHQSCTFTKAYKIFNLTPTFVTDIMNYLDITAETVPIRITPFGSALVIGNPSVYNGSSMALMAGSANLSDTSTTVTKIKGIGKPSKEIVLSEGVTSHTITDQLIRNALAAGNDNIYVEISTTSDVTTRFRVYLKPISDRYAEYRGVTVDRSLGRLFSAVILDNVATAHVHNLANDSTVDGYVCGYGIGI